MNFFYNIDNIYKKDDVALFDYTSKIINDNITKSKCSNANCFEGILNPINNENCKDYRQCLQYFNTLPLVNCIDNVPVPYFLVIDEA